MTLDFFNIPGAENPADYHPGGLHPVHLGDIFNDRYKVTHKLGYGTTSTIWLVEDVKTRTLASLKILSADRAATELIVMQHLEATYSAIEQGSKHVVRMLDHFVHEGPNGVHQCIVGEVLGPSLSSPSLPAIFPCSILDHDMNHRICGQLALAVAYLHKRGVAHGDLHPGNILLTHPYPWTSFEEVYRDLGHPRKHVIHVGQFPDLTPAPPDPHRPEYLVCGLEYHGTLLRTCLRTANIKIGDFGGSYIPSMPVPPQLCSAAIFRPPEAVRGLTLHPTTELDIWALAVLFHLFFTSQALIAADSLDEADDAGSARVCWGMLLGGSMPEGGRERSSFEKLLRRTVRLKPEDRISARGVVKSSWFVCYCRPDMREGAKYDVPDF
ncbi:Protein kinase [Mycena kentingensis (nom. inval.)]|nr:Protein kinase [Mycena kentingensis (nom. inval.)]